MNKQLVKDVTYEWVNWYVLMVLVPEASPLIGLYQAFRANRLRGGVAYLKKHTDTFLNNSSKTQLFPTEALTLLALHHAGVSYERASRLHAQAKRELVESLLEYLANYAQDLPDCTAKLGSDLLPQAELIWLN